MFFGVQTFTREFIRSENKVAWNNNKNLEKIHGFSYPKNMANVEAFLLGHFSKQKSLISEYVVSYENTIPNI